MACNQEVKHECLHHSNNNNNNNHNSPFFGCPTEYTLGPDFHMLYGFKFNNEKDCSSSHSSNSSKSSLDAPFDFESNEKLLFDSVKNRKPKKEKRKKWIPEYSAKEKKIQKNTDFVTHQTYIQTEEVDNFILDQSVKLAKTYQNYFGVDENLLIYFIPFICLLYFCYSIIKYLQNRIYKVEPEAIKQSFYRLRSSVIEKPHKCEECHNECDVSRTFITTKKVLKYNAIYKSIFRTRTQ